MIKNHQLHSSITGIPPHNLVKVPIKKQTFLSNLILGRLKKYGLHQMASFHYTRKLFGDIVYPYMPKRIQENNYLYDFHAHSVNSDGRGTFKEILEEISLKKHLNGLAITDHPWHLGADGKKRIPDEKVILRSFKFHELSEDFKKKGKLPESFITFPGSCEFFMYLGEDFPGSVIELIAIGLPRDFIKNIKDLKRITNGYALEFIERVHDNNGLVIVPHPFYFVRSYELFRSEKSINSLPDAIESINYSTGFLADKGYSELFYKLPFGKEVEYIGLNFGYFNWMATIITQKNRYGKDFNAFPLAREIASLGSSDAHFKSMLGAACTMTKEPITSFEDLRQLFKKKETYPMYNLLWKENTNKYTVFKEIWESYGGTINKGLKERPLLFWKLSKFFVDLLAYFWV